MSLPDPPLERLPISILTGFLGSGKTTLLKALLGHAELADTAVIINEFGEVGLDHLIVAGVREDTLLLASGCICCTVRGDLVRTLDQLMAERTAGTIPPFRRILVETTGLADPAPILHTLIMQSDLSERFRLDGVIATVDAVNGMAQLDRHPESIKQAAVADRLVLTKTDLAGRPAIRALAARLEALNPAARVIEAVGGNVAPARLLDAGLYDPKSKSLDVRRWLKEEAYEAAENHSHHDADHHDHLHHDHGHHHDRDHDPNRHGDTIRSFCLTREAPIPWDGLVGWMEMLTALHGSRLLRIKGLINAPEVAGPVVIHGVQHLFHPPVVLERWPDADRRSRIVFITDGLERALFEETLAAFAPTE